MAAVAFLIPGDLSLPTGGYAYDRHVLGLLEGHGVAARHVALPGSFPSPSAADLAISKALADAVPAGVPLLIDGLALGAMPGAFVASLGRPVVALCHHPLCLEAGLAPERRAALAATETEALAASVATIVTSPATRALLIKDFGVPACRVTVAIPGADPAPRAAGTGSPLQLLAVGSLVPRKGYDVLLAALASLGDRDWRLTIAGADDRDPATTHALRQMLGGPPLAGRVELAGAADEARLAGLYHSADVFVLASHFEGYGMVLGEAMSRGLAIVTTTGGAAADTVPDEAALKVAPGDVAGLGAALARMIDDRSLRARVAKASWVAGQALPRWDETARIIAGVIKGIGV